MLKFGIIAEGPTDQAVIKNILLGYFQKSEAEEPAVNPIQPPATLDENPGGWGQVIESLKRKDCEIALLQFGNDFVVIHADTDEFDRGLQGQTI